MQNNILFNGLNPFPGLFELEQIVNLKPNISYNIFGEPIFSQKKDYSITLKGFSSHSPVFLQFLRTKIKVNLRNNICVTGNTPKIDLDYPGTHFFISVDNKNEEKFYDAPVSNIYLDPKTEKPWTVLYEPILDCIINNFSVSFRESGYEWSVDLVVV